MAESALIESVGTGVAPPCPHRYVTSHGRGWECADCREPLLSLMVPIPLRTIAKALDVIAGGEEQAQAQAIEQGAHE